MSRGASAHPSVARLQPDAIGSSGLGFCSGYVLADGRCVVNAFKGMNGEPTSGSIRCSVTEHGMAYRARALWSRSPHSSRGSNAPPGSAGEPRTGRRVAGNRMYRNRKVRTVRKAETILNIIRNSVRITGKPLEIERLTSGLEGGRWKSTPTCRSNSLAAYPTARRVRRGGSGNVPEGNAPGPYPTIS